jgi:hypothetical protein
VENADQVRLRGLLLLLSRLLVVGHPLVFAIVAAEWIAALPIRGTPLAILLVVRLIVVAAGIAAGVAMTRLHAGSARLAAAALAAAGALQVFIYTTSIAPNNRMPGDTPFYVAGAVLYHAAWIGYLRYSTRARALF